MLQITRTASMLACMNTNLIIHRE